MLIDSFIKRYQISEFFKKLMTPRQFCKQALFDYCRLWRNVQTLRLRLKNERLLEADVLSSTLVSGDTSTHKTSTFTIQHWQVQLLQLLQPLQYCKSFMRLHGTLFVLISDIYIVSFLEDIFLLPGHGEINNLLELQKTCSL